MSSHVSDSVRCFSAAQAWGTHWGLAVKDLLDGLAPLPEAANVGFVYVSPDFADDLSSIVTLLRETTPISQWYGAAGYGVIGPMGERRDGPAIVALVGALNPDGLRPLVNITAADNDALPDELRDWTDRQTRLSALVHGNPRTSSLPDLISALAGDVGAYLVGGLTLSVDQPVQVAGRVTDAALSGVLFGDAVTVAVGMTQGCHPIGPPHLVTEAVDTVVIELDGRPALSVLNEEAGDIIARDPMRAQGYIHVARPQVGSDNRHDYAVRNLLGIDAKRGWIAIGDQISNGDSLMFVRRDANAAQQDLRRMLTSLRDRLHGVQPKGGIYICCMQRGAAMFGREGREMEIIHDVLGDFPLIGFHAAGEICSDQMYGYTGVLVVFL